jgi:NAD(P)H-flavin reductase
VSLIYANQTEGDILLREELEAMAEARPQNFHLHYTCDRCARSWSAARGGSGRSACNRGRAGGSGRVRPLPQISHLNTRGACLQASVQTPLTAFPCQPWCHLSSPDPPDREVSEGWKYSVGHINEAMIREHLLPAGDDSIVAMCGPPGMIKFACIPNLEKAGHKEEALIQF